MINLENITKKYDSRLVLDDISISFKQGQSVAFVGHNGCGKSTLLKVIAKLVTATSGKVTYDKPLLFHYIPEKFAQLSMTGRQYLESMAYIDGMEAKQCESIIDTLSKEFFVDELLDTPMKSLSKGTLQKMVVIQSLLNKPDVILLDEPLSGQDVASQKVFISKINQLRDQGTTIFMSCHERRLVEAIAEDVYTIDYGKLVRYDYKDEKTYLLILENMSNQRVPDIMNRYGQYYSIKASQDRCDEIIPELMERGWKLRGMYDEEDN